MPRKAVDFPTDNQIKQGERHTQPKPPKWSMRSKPAMISGDSVPSWVNSIPGPKYTYNTDVNRPRQPVYSMTGRGKSPFDVKNRPSSAPSGDPGKADKYLSTIKSDPAFSFTSLPSSASKSRRKVAPGTDFLDPKSAGNSMGGQFGGGKGPVWSIGAKLPTEGELMSVRSPGPIYNQNLKDTFGSTPMGKRLATEGELMSLRSPGPCNYGGSAVDIKKQSEIDSTMTKIRSCSFGIGARFASPYV